MERRKSRRSNPLARLGAGILAVACAVPLTVAASSAASADEAGAALTVGPSDDLLGALDAAAGHGGTVTLAPGTYDAAWLDRWTMDDLDLSGVTLRGASRDGVVLQGLTLKGVHGLTVTNLTMVNSPLSLQSVVRVSDGSSDITFDGVTIEPQVLSGLDIWRDTDSITLRGSIVDGTGVNGLAASNGTARAVRINGAPYDLDSWPTNISITGNDLYGAGSDIINIAGAKHVVISGNRIHDPQKNADHNDGIQSFGSDDLKIVGNRFWAPGPNGPDQAIMLGPNRSVSTLRVSNTYIANNIVSAWRGSGISVVSTDGTRIINNTVAPTGEPGARGSSIAMSGNSGLQIVNNILFKVFGTGEVARQDHNCLVDGYAKGDTDTDDPGYDASSDFALDADSVCRNNAATDVATATDISGRQRDSRPDRGAWEYAGDAGSDGSSTSQQVRVDDLDLTSASNGWGPVEVKGSNGSRGAHDGGSLRVDGTTYRSGFGTNSDSSMSFDLPAGCTKLSARVGVDDEVGRRGTVTFQVWVDGDKRYQSGLVQGGDPALSLTTDVSGGRSVTLVTTSAGDGIDYDHGDWLNPTLSC
ncbi:parallel beta-helix repeat protein [Motilibacter peucedani]|uniref:Parallel beta-helix repeat protein n=1 Tax=Motilibacter peucedani TaxID=598650 RepID=A0A420XV68_9ACTN|nr:NPCBM/NEW2 domain-containing protein [Motilibacter peucedani]RKS80734.1 parallel beta-helix repeat protein [Motilibacter peucedani]